MVLALFWGFTLNVLRHQSSPKGRGFRQKGSRFLPLWGFVKLSCALLEKGLFWGFGMRRRSTRLPHSTLAKFPLRPALRRKLVGFGRMARSPGHHPALSRAHARPGGVAGRNMVAEVFKSILRTLVAFFSCPFQLPYYMGKGCTLARSSCEPSLESWECPHKFANIWVSHHGVPVALQPWFLHSLELLIDGPLGVHLSPTHFAFYPKGERLPQDLGYRSIVMEKCYRCEMLSRWNKIREIVSRTIMGASNFSSWVGKIGFYPWTKAHNFASISPKSTFFTRVKFPNISFVVLTFFLATFIGDVRSHMHDFSKTYSSGHANLVHIYLNSSSLVSTRGGWRG